MTQDFQLLPFDRLTTQLLYDILALRADVFVVEQNSAYMDLGGLDAKALHLCLLDNGQLIGYSRIFAPGVKFEEASIGRIVIDKKHRASGLGRRLLQRGMDEVQAAFSHANIRIEAQHHLHGFYESFGFSIVSDIYDWGGIPHVKMLYKHNKA